jgi:hypothetical protein
MDKQAAMVQQFGGNLGQALAAQIAASVAGNRTSGAVSSNTAASVTTGLGSI